MGTVEVERRWLDQVPSRRLEACGTCSSTVSWRHIRSVSTFELITVSGG